MKTIILAGGLGTRISEETETKPKPMVLLDDLPILWHIMTIYAFQGFNDFVIATGYKSEVISDWVKNLKSNFRIEIVNTGIETQTGGRIRQCMERYPGESFFVTYGDGLANVNINDLYNFHRQQGKIATVTAVRPPARFGVLEINNGLVTHFGEKNQSDVGWINGGFFVLDPQVLSFLTQDKEPFEGEPIANLVSQNNLTAYQHFGFWQPMDTLREKKILADFLKRGETPWLPNNSHISNPY
jgi:glucose-1-phosphate cytidylyltransferase